MSQSLAPITVAETAAAVRQWFELMGSCCASVDYDSARVIFATDVVLFGAKADVLAGLDTAQELQWEGIWPNIRDFRFDPGSIHWGGDESHAWGVAT